jgi:hypothetical protein
MNKDSRRAKVDLKSTSPFEATREII